MTEPLSSDQAFIEKLTSIVIANLANENFGVEDLSKLAGMSHATIHRKIKSIRNQNISKFIREIRLQKSMEMLQRGEGTIAEVAFRSGFGSPTYFIKCFHEHYGFSPGEVRKKKIAASPDVPAIGQTIKPADDKKPESGFNLKSIGKSRRNKNILIASFGILSVMLVIAFAYVLLKPPEKSIVVLPFRNLSNDPGNQYFADGIQEGILNHLFRIGEMRVISRTTAEYFRDNPMTSPEIGRKLKVLYVLEGSVQRYEQKVRIFVQLIDARDDQHMFSEEYEGELTNLFAYQSDIAKRVADELKMAITGEAKRHIEKIPTVNPEAYDYYLKGRFLLHKANDQQRNDVSKEGLMASLEYYEKAIAADSNFVEAYAGLANAWYNLSAWGWYQPYFEGVKKAHYFCNRALQIDPDCAEAHAVLGVYHIYPELRIEEGRRELKTALKLNPNFSTAHQWYAQLLMITGPIEEAREHIDRALELEPYFWVIHNLNSWIYYFEEKYLEGIDACLAAYDLNPDFLTNNWLLVLHYAKLGEGEKAVKALQQLFNRYPSISHYAAEVNDAYTESGIEGIFTWLIELNKNNPIPIEGLNGHPFYISWWYAITGNREESIYWLERTVEEKYIPRHYFNLIANNPDFDILRDDPRFLAIIEKEGLTPYHKRKAR
ncbi:MAG: helix-turn-helix domain-containing protein [Bacteroidales bacterium]|jgi:TolB-like protein/AraC-like DNA-binding protein/lipoprotein NlpI|nr:helix-turn-helix domain-containing protein [Bacteroidales bacterium]